MFATVHFFKPLLYWYSYILTSSNNRVKTAVQSIEDSDVEKRTNFNLHRATFTNYLTSLNFFVKQLNFRYSEIENSYFVWFTIPVTLMFLKNPTSIVPTGKLHHRL